MAKGFLCIGAPEYGWEDKLKKLTPRQWDDWKRRAVSMAKHFTAETNQANFKPGWVSELMMDGEEVEAWGDAGINITMSRVKGLASNSEELHKTVYQMSVANSGLMNIQKLDILEQGEVRDVQYMLDRGWRIVAVCPSNKGDLPDYVMGHFEKDPRD